MSRWAFLTWFDRWRHSHTHICRDCPPGFRRWRCYSAGRLWDQEDSDCRWHKHVLCPRHAALYRIQLLEAKHGTGRKANRA